VTLTEILVATSTLGLLLGGLLALLEGGQVAYSVGAARVESQQNARIALARLATDLRGAGGGAPEARLDAITVAEPARIALQQDLDGDGRAATRGETIIWRLDGAVLRRHAGAGGQPVVNGVRALRFTYLDADGAETAAPGEVRSVDVTLVTEPAHRAGGAAAGTGDVVTTRIRLRNR
jgi:type II secretory pathway component PulJ